LAGQAHSGGAAGPGGGLAAIGRNVLGLKTQFGIGADWRRTAGLAQELGLDVPLLAGGPPALPSGGRATGAFSSADCTPLWPIGLFQRWSVAADQGPTASAPPWAMARWPCELRRGLLWSASLDFGTPESCAGSCGLAGERNCACARSWQSVVEPEAGSVRQGLALLSQDDARVGVG